MNTIKTYKCDCCAYVSNRNQNLLRHKNSIHAAKITKEQELVNLLQEVKNIENNLVLKKARIAELEIALFENTH